MQHIDNIALPPLTRIEQVLAHLEHVLPGQGPILDFIHHNTIHGFQHFPFFEALEQFETLTGIRGFQADAVNRDFYAKGRITAGDLAAVIKADVTLQAAASMFQVEGRAVTRGEVLQLLLVHELPSPGPAQLHYLLLQGEGLQQCTPGIGSSASTALLQGQAQPAAALHALWSTLLELLELKIQEPEPEAVQEHFLQQTWQQEEPALRAAAQHKVAEQFARVGPELTLRGLVLLMTGTDMLERIRPQLIRLGASLLDEGMASWHITHQEQPFLYSAWLQTAALDLRAQLFDATHIAVVLQDLAQDPLAAIVQQLQALQLPPQHWETYLERLTLELPGWAGLICWRQQHPHYHSGSPAQPRLADFLAIRLILDRLCLMQTCKELWHIKGDWLSLHTHFISKPLEFWLRCQQQEGALPEYLGQKVAAMLLEVEVDTPEQKEEQTLALQVWHWQQQLLQQAKCHSLEEFSASSALAWRLFCLCQHLGLTAQALRALGRPALESLQQVLTLCTPQLRGKLWLQAFERHYRDDILTALALNHQRGSWQIQQQRPLAQIVMCMDEREESFRRHLEEVNPAIETLGAAGFFGIPMQYQGLDSHHSTPLCPVVVTPAHKIEEVPREVSDNALHKHQRGRRLLESLVFQLYQQLRLAPVRALLWCLLGLPVLLLALLLDSVLPGLYSKVRKRSKQWLVPAVSTRLTLTAGEDTPRHDEGLQLGFNTTEQGQRVAGLLRTLGLTRNFAPIVALAGHGSTSQNNPHEAAHDCGACGGRQGGPNARTFAAMANRPEVRALLRQQGIDIPDDTWFVGLQHDTCSDALTWYDLELVPEHCQQAFAKFQLCMQDAQQRSAHERCRRFHSAQVGNEPARGFHHVTLRSQDLTQVRPEYGHATNAAAVIGRRQLTRGIFLDRRMFLISYDATQDPEGSIVENILLTAGPVGAGINLEYYFSTIDNERFGCGTKIPHNVTGLCAVMEGSSSDLRTGLPLQMVEIHEAMRLQVIVEATTEVLTKIYLRQPALQELVGGGWLLLTAMDPHTGTLSCFDPAVGFVPWQPEQPSLPCAQHSLECYQGLSTPVSARLIHPPADIRSVAA